MFSAAHSACVLLQCSRCFPCGHLFAILIVSFLVFLCVRASLPRHFTIIGNAASGKSAIINVLKHIFKAEDVAVAASSMETTFGLSGMHDSYVWTISEMTADFKMDYADWVSR